MIEGRPGVDDLVRLARGGRDSVTIYSPIDPAHDWREVAGVLREAMKTAVGRLVSRGAGHDTHWAIEQQFLQLTRKARYRGRSIALFLTAESAEGYLLPDRVEPAVRVADHFDLGPLLRAITAAHQVYGITLTEGDWGLWETSGEEPARLITGNTRERMPSAADPRHLAFALFQHLTSGSAYFLRRGAFVRQALDQARRRLLDLDPYGSSLLVLFADDEIAGSVDGRPISGLLEDIGLPWPVELVSGDADALTPGQVGRELRRQGRRFIQRELSTRIRRLRAEDADGYPSTDLAEIALAAADHRVRLLVYDCTDPRYGTLDPATGEFRADQWGYDVLARIAVDVLAGGGEVFAVTPDELLAGSLDGQLLAEIAYPPPH